MIHHIMSLFSRIVLWLVLQLGQKLGYDKSTFTCSSACTDVVNAPEWRYYWQVNMPAATNTTWMTCGDPCDSALRIWGDTVVECVLNKLCPSHTYVIFKYPE